MKLSKKNIYMSLSLITITSIGSYVFAEQIGLSNQTNSYYEQVEAAKQTATAANSIANAQQAIVDINTKNNAKITAMADSLQNIQTLIERQTQLIAKQQQIIEEQRDYLSAMLKYMAQQNQIHQQPQHLQNDSSPMQPQH